MPRTQAGRLIHGGRSGRLLLMAAGVASAFALFGVSEVTAQREAVRNLAELDSLAATMTSSYLRAPLDYARPVVDDEAPVRSSAPHCPKNSPASSLIAPRANPDDGQPWSARAALRSSRSFTVARRSSASVG